MRLHSHDIPIIPGVGKCMSCNLLSAPFPSLQVIPQKLPEKNKRHLKTTPSHLYNLVWVNYHISLT